MTKAISKIGNSHGLVFDSALMELAHLKAGDQMNVTIHEGGVIMLTPVRPHIEPKMAVATARRLIRKNADLFKRLA